MTTELILLLLISFLLFSKFVGGARTTFQKGTPQMAIRLEKHLMTGYLFSLRAGDENGPGNVGWDEPL